MVQYNVTGMSCAACSARVEKAVSAVSGVTGCSVSLLTNSMGVEGSAAAADIIAAVEAADIGSHVDAHHIALAYLPRAGDPVDHLLIDGNTHAGGITAVVQEGRLRALTDNEIMDRFVDGFRRYAGLYHFPC